MARKDDPPDVPRADVRLRPVPRYAGGLAALTSQGMAKGLAQFFPVLGMPATTYAVGAVLVVVLGGLAAAQPSMQAARLKIVDALRKV